MQPATEAAVIVNGAGLAGSACAIRLRQLGHSVILIDAARFPRRKLCGEFLGPDAMPVLETLGLLKTVIEQSGAQVHTVHLYNTEGNPLKVKMEWLRQDYPYALAISRLILDTLLVEQAKMLGAIVQEGCTIQEGVYSSTQNEFELTIKPVNSPLAMSQHLKSSILVDASGRNSNLATIVKIPRHAESIEKASSPRGAKQIEPYVGVQCHIDVTNESTDLNMYFFPGGYGGIQPFTANTANLCLWVTPELAKLSKQDFRTFLHYTLGQNKAARLHLGSAKASEAIKTVAGLHSLHQIRTSSQTLLSAGDALLAVEPFSGFGMSHALQTGLLVADCIHQGLENAQTYEQIRKQYLLRYQAQFKLQFQVMCWMRPLLKQMFLQKLLWPAIQPMLPAIIRFYR